MRVLNLVELLSAFERIESLPAPIRDLGLLESALRRPETAVFGASLYPSLDLKVAALCDSIARSHPLIDGNKRLSYIAARLTFHLNGRKNTTFDQDQLHELLLEIADARFEVPELAEKFAHVFVA
jgi:death-on-curing protein